MKDLQNAAIAFVIISITCAIGSIIIDDMKSQGDYSNETNASLDAGIAGIGELTGWLQLIGLVIAASVILAYVQAGIGGEEQKVG